MGDNLVISRQFMQDIYRAKCQQLRALQAEVAQYKRWLELSATDSTGHGLVNDGVPFPPEPNVTGLPGGRAEESEWS